MNRIFYYLILLLLTGLLSGCSSNYEKPQAVGGVIDLSRWDFNGHGPVELVGQWQFYRQKLLGPSGIDASSNPELIVLPGLWAEAELEAGELAALGHATYRLVVQLPVGTKKLALMVKGPLSVARIFVSGREVGASGSVGTDRETEQPKLHMLTPAFSADGGVAEIVLQLSNYHNVKGGLKIPILLGTPEQIQLQVNRNWSIAAVLGGVLLVMGICHLILFVFLRGARANLYFGLFCISWSVSTVAGETWGFLVANMLPSLPWEATIYLALVPYAFSTPLVVMFYHSLFAKRYSRIVESIYQGLGLIYLVYLFATPPNAFGSGVILYSLAATTLFPYLFFQFTRDLKDRKKDVLLLVPGYLLLAVNGIIGRLIDFQFADIIPLAPVGTYAFILSYSVLISLRFARSLRTVRRLAKELEQTKKRLADSSTVSTVLESVNIDKHYVDLSQAKQQRRLLAVKVMNLSLSLWYEGTGLSKHELAAQSGIWKVYMDKNGWQRTQTLDKYLNLETIPLQPRYKLVITTAEYVLSQGSGSPLKAEMILALDKLKGFH